MNTQQLECFVRVAEKLNFTKAAEELFLSTPAVTHHIKHLEEELGTTLLIRTSRMVKLTEAGALFYGEAKDILMKMTLAEKRVKKLAGKKPAVIRIGCSSQAEFSVLEAPLIRLREEFPSVYPQILIQNYNILETMFNNEKLDILLGTREMTSGIRRHVFKKIRTIEIFAVVSAAFPLASQTEICLQELRDVPLITLHPRLIPFQYGNKLQEFITLHAQDHFQLLCESDHAAFLLAKCGYGAVILPEIYIPRQEPQIRCLRLSDPQPVAEYGISFHPNQKEAHIRQFIRFLSETSFMQTESSHSAPAPDQKPSGSPAQSDPAKIHG